MIFDEGLTFLDIHDATRDATLAKYVMNVHTGAANREAGEDEIDMPTLKKWV